MKIEFLGPQPHNTDLFAVPLAVCVQSSETEDGEIVTIVAVWLLWFNLAWMVTR